MLRVVLRIVVSPQFKRESQGFRRPLLYPPELRRLGSVVTTGRLFDRRPNRQLESTTWVTVGSHASDGAAWPRSGTSYS
jgi:hypothetical protein